MIWFDLKSHSHNYYFVNLVGLLGQLKFIISQALDATHHSHSIQLGHQTFVLLLYNNLLNNQI
jgi:hypothetical protein